ncbi:MAG TPA: helix-turn-helix transcriptional regulator [Acidimicrobiales bacterium]
MAESGSGSSGAIDLPWLLRAWRTQVAGLTQKEVSARIHLASHTPLCEWENGARPVPIERLRELDDAYGAGGALVDLALALGTPRAVPPRTVWSHNFSGRGPVWMWLRPPPGSRRVRAVARWAAFAYDCDEVTGERGLFCTSRTSMPNPALSVTLPEPGWVDFGEGELPPALGLRQVDVMPGCRVVGDGHSPAGLVAPAVVDRFLTDPAFADDVVQFFGTSPEVVRHVFGTRRGWDRIDDLTGSRWRDRTPPVGPLVSGDEHRRMREGRGLSQHDAAVLATELLPDERDRRGRRRTVTVDNIRGVEQGRRPRRRYLRSRLDRVYRADGRTGTEAVPARRTGGTGAGTRTRAGTYVFDIPAFWVGPVWFAVEAGDDSPAVVRIDWRDIHKEVRVAGRVVVTCRQPSGPQHPFTVTCPPGWTVTGGMGWMPGAEDVNLGWHRQAGPERQGTINEHLLEGFGRTMAEWNDLLRRYSRLGRESPLGRERRLSRQVRSAS